MRVGRGLLARLALPAVIAASAATSSAQAPCSRFASLPAERMSTLEIHLDVVDAAWHGPSRAMPPDLAFLSKGNASQPDSSVHRFYEGADWLGARAVLAQVIRIRVAPAELAAMLNGLVALPQVWGAAGDAVRGASTSLTLQDGAGESGAACVVALDQRAAAECVSRIKKALPGRADIARLLDSWSCEVGLAPLSAATDVTDALSVESSVLRREASGLVDVKVRVINNSEDFVASPLTLVIGSAVGAFLVSPDGYTCTSRPSGRPYVALTAPNGLAPWNSVGAVLRFKNPPAGPIDLSARVYSGSATP